MTRTSRTTDLQELLESADHESLKAFLLAQARRNLAFEVKLRTHLVKQTETSPDANKYSEILGLLVAYDTHGKIHLSKRNLQLLRDVCDHFVSVQHELLGTSDFREAWDSAIAVILSLNLFLDKNPDAAPKLVHLLTESYRSVHELLLRSPAPELRQKIFEILFEIASRGHHKTYDIGYNAITCLIPAASDQEDLEKIQETVVTRIKEIMTVDSPQRKLWFALLTKIPNPEIPLRSTIPPEQVYDIGHLLHAARDVTALSRLLTEFNPPATLSRPQQAQWARWKFELAVQLADVKNIITSGIELLMHDPDIKTYRRIKASTRDLTLYEKIQNPDIPDTLRGEIHAEEHQWNKLINLIRKTSSLPMLTNHLEGILESEEDPISLILEIAHAFVVHTGGRSAVEQVGKTMAMLKQLNQAAIVAALVEHLRHEFPGRFDTILKPAQRVKEALRNIESEVSDTPT